MSDVAHAHRALAVLAEGIGTAALVAVVVGSGVMGERLAGGNAAIALLANAGATGAALYVLIAILEPVSGAHFNPLVTALASLRGRLATRAAVGYVLAQILGGIVGTLLAHAMFALPVLEIATKPRTGFGQFASEVVATLGLLATIRLGARARPDALPALVGAYIAAAYWFTASTSFANPAVTIARTLTDTFAGIRPIDAPAFIAAQALAAAAFATADRALGRMAARDASRADEPPGDLDAHAPSPVVPPQAGARLH